MQHTTGSSLLPSKEDMLYYQIYNIYNLRKLHIYSSKSSTMRIVGFMPFPKAIAWYEMQITLSSIWTLAAGSNFSHYNHYASSTTSNYRSNNITSSVSFFFNMSELSAFNWTSGIHIRNHNTSNLNIFYHFINKITTLVHHQIVHVSLEHSCIGKWEKGRVHKELEKFISFFCVIVLSIPFPSLVPPPQLSPFPHTTVSISFNGAFALIKEASL